MNTLNQPTVLVLNRNWQAINVRTPAIAFCQLATGVATALHVDGDDLRPVTWGEWIVLPVREQDRAVRTARGPIRIPTIIVALNYTRVPRRRPRLCARAIRERDGNRCQYQPKEIHETRPPIPKPAALPQELQTHPHPAQSTCREGDPRVPPFPRRSEPQTDLTQPGGAALAAAPPPLQNHQLHPSLQ